MEESEIIKEYTSLTEEKWFRAKEALDDHFPPDMDETSKLEVLCDIIMVSLLLLKAVPVCLYQIAQISPCQEPSKEYFGLSLKEAQGVLTWSNHISFQAFHGHNKWSARNDTILN